MTLPLELPVSSSSFTPTNKSPIQKTEKEKEIYTPRIPKPYDQKKITKFDINISDQCTEKTSPDCFLMNLPDTLSNDLGIIKSTCIDDAQLIEILDGRGPGYNLLILFLNKIQPIMDEFEYNEEDRKIVEKNISKFLTDGKVELVSDIGRELNHLEESYQSRKWTPNSEDQHFFDQDHKNCDQQNSQADFFPKWMKETEIVLGIPASEATLAYWNFRHSEENDDRGRICDTLIKQKDPGLYYWIFRLRELKTALNNPDTSDSCLPGLTKFHIGAIAARLDYADQVANAEAKTNSDYRTYCWDVQSYKTQKRRKSKGKRSDMVQTTEKTLKESARFSPACSTSSFEEEGKNACPQTSTSDRPKRMRRPNPKYQDFTATADVSSRKSTPSLPETYKKISQVESETLLMETGFPELEKERQEVASLSSRKRKSTPSLPDAYKKISREESEELLKETGIPKLKITIGSVLEKERQRLVEHLDITTFKKDEYSCRWELVDVMSAQDELSRLYEACRRHLGSYKSSYIGKMNEDPIDIPKEQKKIDASLKADEIFEYENPKINMHFSNREQELLEARNALITLLDRAEDLSSKPAKIQVPIEEDEDAPAWESLEVVIRSPMTSLKKVLELGNSDLSDVEMQEISSTLEEDTKELIRKYRYKAYVWDPADARDNIQGKINKLKKLQSIFLKARNSILNTKQNLKKTDYKKEDNQKINRQLENIQTVLRNTTIVLILLQDFSSHLKSERHRELYDRLSKSLESWGKCMRDTPINQLLTA